MLPCSVKLALHSANLPHRLPSATPCPCFITSLSHHVIASPFIYHEPCGRSVVTLTESYSFARITPKPNGILLFQDDPRGYPRTTLVTKPSHSQSPSALTTRTNPQPTEERTP